MIRIFTVLIIALLLTGCPEKPPEKPAVHDSGINPAADLPEPKIDIMVENTTKLSATPGSINFGNVAEYQSVHRTIGIINTFDDKVKINTVKLYGAENLYKITGGCNTDEILAPQDRCSLSITYTPLDTALHEGEILVTYTDGIPLKIAISGQGQAPTAPPTDPAYIRALEIAGLRQTTAISINQNNSIIEESQQNDFINGTATKYPQGMFPSTYSTLPVDRSRIITADRYIPAVLENTINSELTEGRIIAVVERHIYGSDGRLVLIPAGSRVIGKYASLQQFGDSRLPVLWHRIIRPDGASIKIQAEGADPMGRLGLVGHVDNRFFQKYGSSILVSFLSVLPDYFLGEETTSTSAGDSITSTSSGSSRATQQFSEDMSYLAQRVIQENLRLEPIITIPKGTRLLIIPSQDIYLSNPESLIGLSNNQSNTKPMSSQGQNNSIASRYFNNMKNDLTDATKKAGQDIKNTVKNFTDNPSNTRLYRPK